MKFNLLLHRSVHQWGGTANGLFQTIRPPKFLLVIICNTAQNTHRPKLELFCTFDWGALSWCWHANVDSLKKFWRRSSGGIFLLIERECRLVTDITCTRLICWMDNCFISYFWRWWGALEWSIRNGAKTFCRVPASTRRPDSHTAMKTKVLVVYPGHTDLLNSSPRMQCWYIQYRHTVVAFLSVRGANMKRENGG